MQKPESSFADSLPHYLALMRVEKPIGWLLLLWPTLTALWIAGDGQPPAMIVAIFVAGVFVMRAAGCVMNDWADRDIDPLVERTQQRPLASGKLRAGQAMTLFLLLCLCALCLLLMLPVAVWPWSVPALAVTIIYPFMKRHIAAPQLVLGIAFSFSIPMAYVALGQAFDLAFWLLLAMNFSWVLAYDTEYAMSDRPDDLKIGVNSTAILFGRFDRIIVAVLQCLVVLLYAMLGVVAVGSTFIPAVLLVAALFLYQQWLIAARERNQCLQAFLNNAWVGAVIWFGIVLSLLAARA